jgi:hypothetical protein
MNQYNIICHSITIQQDILNNKIRNYYTPFRIADKQSPYDVRRHGRDVTDVKVIRRTSQGQ